MNKKNMQLLCVLLLVLVLFSSCNKPKEQVNSNFLESTIANVKANILDKLELSKNEDGTFSSFPDEMSSEYYSTYYSLLFLNNMNIDVTRPTAKNISFETITSIYELLYIAKSYQDIDTVKLYKALNDFYCDDGYFLIDKGYKTNNIYTDENILFSTWQGCKILSTFHNDFDYSKVKQWLEASYKSYSDNLAIDIDTFESLFMYYELMLLCNSNTEHITNYMSSNFREYEVLLFDTIGNIEFLFNVITYINLLDHLDIEPKYELFNATKIIECYESPTGLPVVILGEEPNPYPVYAFSELFNKFNYTYDYAKCIKLVLRHQRDDNTFAPYVLLEGEKESTFYAYLTLDAMNALDTTNNIYFNDSTTQDARTIYLENLFFGYTNYGHIFDLLTNLSSDERITKREADDAILLLDVLRSQQKELPLDIKNSLCNSFKNEYNFLKSEKDEGKKHANSLNEYAVLSAHVLLCNSECDEHKVLFKNVSSILDDLPYNNLIRTYYYTRLMEIAIAEYDYSISAEQYNHIQLTLNDTITDSEFFSYEVSESSVSMVSNYMGIYIYNFLCINTPE